MGHHRVQELPELLHPQQVVAKRLRFGGGGAGARCRVFGCLGQSFSLPWTVSAFFCASPYPWHSFPCSGWTYWPGSQDSLLGVQPILQVILVVETNGHQVLFSQKCFKRSKRLLPALAHISRCFSACFCRLLSLFLGPLSFPRDTSCPPRSQLESLGNQRCFWVQKSSWLWHGQRGLSITPQKCCRLAAPSRIPAEGKGPGLHLLSCSCSQTPA